MRNFEEIFSLCLRQKVPILLLRILLPSRVTGTLPALEIGFWKGLCHIRSDVSTESPLWPCPGVEKWESIIPWSSRSEHVHYCLELFASARKGESNSFFDGANANKISLNHLSFFSALCITGFPVAARPSRHFCFVSIMLLPLPLTHIKRSGFSPFLTR